MSQARHKILQREQAQESNALAQLGLTDDMSEVSNHWVAEAVATVSRLWVLHLVFKLCLIMVMLDLPLLYRDIWSAAPITLGAMLLVDLAIFAMPRIPTVRMRFPHHQMRLLGALVAAAGFMVTLWLCALPAPLISQRVPTIVGLMCLSQLALAIFGGRAILNLVYCLGATLALLASYGLPTLYWAAPFIAAMSLLTLLQARTDQRRRVQEHRDHIHGIRAEQLLHEYEESGHGWFWETDREGRIAYISATLANSLNVPTAKLVGKQLTDLVATGDRIANDGDRTLGFHLTARASFSELAVRVAHTQDERWWSISGRPILNEYGQFIGFRGSGSDLTEMRRHQVEVNRLAQYDSLTGLPNRVQMLRTLEQSVADISGRSGECALFLLDLDRFKSVNDTLGHPAGDALLRQVAHRLQQVVGERGRVGRLGGDEFKVVLPGVTDHRSLALLADTIIAQLSEPYMIEGTKVVIGASVGIAICPDDGSTSDALIRNADLALYAAKGDGRGMHRFYSADMHADAEDRRQLETDLRHALATDGLTIVYQPVVNASSELVTGFEALLRWEHPTRGDISPALFIPIAEEANLITQIGEWVLRTACQDAARWPDPVRVAVNVSPIQFANPSLPNTVMSALATANLPAHRLELEITESVFLNDDDATEAMFARLKAVGVRLALDDFGTGYSSLGYLKKAPFDKIKIDQSFVRGAAENGSRNSAIIRSIVTLAEALGMDTTAEGVETFEELDLVRSLGCSHIQGYIYGRGIKLADTLARFTEQGLQADANGGKRSRPQRKSVLRTVNVHHSGHCYTARIRNISAEGALIEGLWNVPVDTVFTVDITENISVDAVARWSLRDRMGIQFVETVELAQFQVTPTQAPLRAAG